MPACRVIRRAPLGLLVAIAIAACGGDEKEKTAKHSPPPAPEDEAPEPEDEAPTPEDDAPEPEDEAPKPEDDAPERAACETLDRAECLSSRQCTMHWIEDFRYECRPAEGACEVDLTQGDKTACEARDGCTWNPGSCYCQFPGYGQTQVKDKDKNAGGACACGGGPPPMCESAKDA